MKVIIFYSGGKDSQACLIHSILKYGVHNCEAVFFDTGFEHPITYNHIIETTNQLNVKLVIIKSSKYKNFFHLSLLKKRFPSTKARFCTTELKIKPSIDYILQQNEHLIIIEGIRKAESFSRSQMQHSCTYFKYYFNELSNGKYFNYRKADVIEWTKKFNADKLRPLFDWSADQVINYILSHNQKPNQLYYKGFSRVGCFPCIMSRHSSIKNIIINFPEQWQSLKIAESNIKSSFFPPKFIPNKYCTGKSSKGIKFPTLPDVEKYLLNKNTTLDLFENEEISCSSFYNLCN